MAVQENHPVGYVIVGLDPNSPPEVIGTFVSVGQARIWANAYRMYEPYEIVPLNSQYDPIYRKEDRINLNPNNDRDLSIDKDQ